ncbi:MAG: DUF2333 family protein [Gammaproteobacteria bacterium]
MFERLRNWRAQREDHEGVPLKYRLLWLLLVLPALALYVLSYFWDVDQAYFKTPRIEVITAARARTGGASEVQMTPGSVTTSTLIEVASFLIDKPGGYLTNDVTPPGILMDNTQSWEFGVVVQMRDLTRLLRNDFSRSQTQSSDDPDLALADPHFHNDTEGWLFPSYEGQVQAGLDALERYLRRLQQTDDAEFFARADNLAEWLALVARRLGDQSQRLSASVGRETVNVDLSGDSSAPVPVRSIRGARTPYMEIDNVFFEARGATWAILHFMRAIAVDFKLVLEDKNAMVSVRNILRNLRETQNTLGSPVILNGTGFAVFANHSLVMASYIARANTAIIDLIKLLQQG